MDFISVGKKRDGALVSSGQSRKLLYNSLLWKLATFFVEERWRTAQPTNDEEEDDTDARQRGRVRHTIRGLEHACMEVL